MTRRLRPLLLPALFVVVVGAILVGLGVWQLHRLAWKDAIVAQIEARTKAEPQSLPPSTSWFKLKPADYEYRRVTFEGTFRNDQETLVYRAMDDGPGYLVLTPLSLQSGGTLIVNRGFIPATLKHRGTRTAGEPHGPVRVTGLMRQPEPRNLFTPADDVAHGMFFTRDPQLIAARFGLIDAAPFTVDADSTPNPGGWPRGGTTQIAIPNNHLSYALTWFGLALALIGVFSTFAWRRLAEPRRAEERHQPA